MLTAKNSAHRDWFLAAFLIIGIILAASDGQWFPFPNLVGIILIGLCSLSGNQKVEHVKDREVSWKVRKPPQRRPIHFPIRPEPEISGASLGKKAYV